MHLNAAGQVEPKLETPWRDGTAHLVMSPLELMQRLADPVGTTLNLSREVRASDCFAAGTP